MVRQARHLLRLGHRRRDVRHAVHFPRIPLRFRRLLFRHSRRDRLGARGNGGRGFRLHDRLRLHGGPERLPVRPPGRARALSHRRALHGGGADALLDERVPGRLDRLLRHPAGVQLRGAWIHSAHGHRPALVRPAAGARLRGIPGRRGPGLPRRRGAERGIDRAHRMAGNDVVVRHCRDGGADPHQRPVPSPFRRARRPRARWPVRATRRAHRACQDRRDHRGGGPHAGLLAAGPRRHHDRHCAT